MSKFCTIPNKKDFEKFSKGTNIDPLRMSNIYTIAVNKSNKDNNTNEIILPTVKEFLTVLNNIVNESPDKTLNVSNLKISELPPRFFQTLAPLNKAQYKRLLSEGRQDYINEYKSLYNKQTSFIGKIRDHIVNSVFKKSNNLMTSSKITEASIIMSNLIYETLLNRAAQLRTKYNDKSISVNDIIKGVFNKNTVEQVIQTIVSHELKNAKKRADANGEVFEENEYLKILQENPELITKGVLANLKTTYGIIIKTKKPVKTVDEVVVINNEQTDEVNETEEEEEKSLVKTDTEENAADILGELYEQSSNAEVLDKNEITVNNFNKDNISSIKSVVKQLRVILANLNILDLSNNTETDFRGTSKNMLGLNKKVDFTIAFNTLMSLFSGEQVVGDNLKNSPEIVESSDIIKFLIDQSVSYPWMLNLLDLYKSESKTAENLLNVLDNYLFVEKKSIKNFEKWYNSKNKVPYENVLKVIASESGLNALLFTNFYKQKNIYMIQFKNNQMKFINKANTSTKIFKQLVNKLSSGVLLITPKITSNTKAKYNLGTTQNPKEFTEVLKNIQNEYDSINKEMLEQEITAKSFLDDEFLYNPKNKLLLNRLNNLFNMFGANLTQKDFTQLLYDKDKQHIPLIYKNISDIIYKDNERYANIKDLLLFTSTFTQNLKALSEELIPIYSDYVEPSSRELGKSYYSHVLPDHTSTLLKRFRNKSSAAQELEYWAQDSMMYTDGVYNSHYLNLLKKGQLVLEHFPQLHYDKKPIEDFTNKDYLKSALNHFLNHLRLDSFKDTALYVNMITGDANSHIIFKAPRLPSQFIDSSTVTVQRALAETVFAEALRITALTAVSKNDKYSKNGLLRYVASYDINGEPIYKETPFSKNGKRFHTFAQLNTNKELNDAILNKKTGIMFMQNMDRNAKIKAIEDLLSGIVEENGNEIIVEENNVFQQEIDAVYNLLLKYNLIKESKNRYEALGFGKKSNLSEKNIFTVEPIQSVDKKAKPKAKIATQYIGFAEGITDSSTALYAKQAGKYANTGNYSSNDVIFVSVSGKRGNEVVRKQQQDKTIREAIKALDAGATLVTDNAAYVESNPYNEGEKRLAANLKAKGYNYSEIIVDGHLLGVWNKNTNQIYSKLGNKTKSENVVIKSWGELKNVKEAITPNHIVSTRIQGTDKHFGNPFSHEFSGKLIKTETIKEAVERFTDWVINSKEERAKWIREQLKSGKLKGKPILYYKELGEPSHATALDYLINKYNWDTQITSQQSHDNVTKNYNENSQENTISSSEIPLLNGAEALVKSHIKNFALNDIFAQSQFHLLISNDVAQNKNLPDIQKRDKQTVSPGQIYDKHIWKKLTGSFDINYVLVSDQMIKSNILNNIKNILDNNEKLTQEERDSIMSKYESIESTDGQSYITLEARKNKLKSLGVTMWTDNHEKAYNNIVSGKFTKADLDLLGQETDKPQVYTKIMKKVGPYTFRVGMQVKTSEYLILPTTVKSENNPTYNSKETDISAFMEAHNIHVLAFNSAVKVGLFQNISFPDFIKKVDKFKNDKIVDNTFKETNIVKVPIEDVKKQQEISDHITHSKQIIGSQLKKIIVTDIPEKLNFNGKNIDANHFKILVKQFYEESVKKAYQKLEKRFANKEAILEFIQEQLLVSNEYSPELLELYTEIKNAEDVPLFDPQNSAIHEQLLLSAIKNDIINLKMKGGSLVQISASPSNDLRVVFNEDGKTIKHIPAIMPWAMKESIEFALDKDGYIDTSLVDEDVLKVIGYRIPSEHKYSIFPIKVIKFSDKSSGNNILLPHELIIMAGFDFDIDKLYVMLPEVVEDITGTLKKVEYNNTELYNVKDLGKNSQKALNNLFFDLTWASVTNKEATDEMFIPGGFDNWITASEILQVKEILGEDVSFEEIENMSKEQIEEILDNNSDNRSIYSMETRLDFRKKNAAAAKLIGVMANQIPSHSIAQMTDMVIKNPIKLFIEDQPIKHLGKKLAIVSEKSTKGKKVIGKIVQISRRIAQSVAASVDAVKQPILDIININMFTADVTSVLLRSVSEKGYGATDLQIGVFLNQPVIKTLSEEFENINQAVKKISKIKFINDVLKPYIRNKEGIAKINTLKNSALNFENLEKEFLDKDIDLLNLSETQLHVLIKFVQLSEVGQDLNNVSDLMKNDTSNSGLETSIFEGLQLQERIEKLKTQLKEDHDFFLQKREEGSDLSISFKNPFISFKEYVDLAVIESEDLSSYALVPYVNEAYEYGIKKPLELLEKFFPYNTDLYKGMIKDFSELMYVNKTLKKKLVVDFTTFLATSNKSLFEDHFKNPDNYKEFVSNFPKVIAYMKTSDKIPQEIKNLPILSLLESVRIPGSNVNILQLQLDGAFTKEQKQVFTESWKTLHEITPEIAEGLVRYEILRNGLKFTPNSFGYLAPVKIINSIEGYYKDIQNILKLDYNSSLTKSFIEQFIANNIALIPSTKADMNNFKEGDYENYYLPTLETKPPKIVYLEEVISSSEIKRNYYKLETETSTKEFYHYKKMNLLGIPNLFTEYNSNVVLNNFEDFQSAFSEINTPKLNYENIGENGFQFFTTVLEDSTNNKEFFNELISETSEEVVENFKEIDTSLKININDLFSENTSILDNIKPTKTVDDNGQINC